MRLFPLFNLLTLFTLVITLLLLGCAPAYRANIDYTESEGILWPGGGERPRIKYLWSLHSLAPQTSFVDFLAGGGDPTDPKTSLALILPNGIYFENDRLYIADSGAMRATVINIKTLEVLQLGVSGKGELEFPIGIVADKAGNIYVSDSDINKVLVYDTNGKFTGYLSDVKFVKPTGLAYDREKDIVYVVDTQDHKVYGISPANGSVRVILGKRGEADGEFNFPSYITLDKDGKIWVSDILNFRIQSFDRQGKFISKFGSVGDSYAAFALPKGIAADSEGNIYVVDSRKDMVKIFSNTGRFLLPFGAEGNDRGMFWLPAGIFIDKDDKIYVADSYNRRVQVFQFLRGK